MGTTNGGLSRLKDGVFTTFGEQDWFGAYVVELFREPDGSILAWSVGKGIRRIVSSDTSVAFHSTELHPATRCVRYDHSSGVRWLGTPVGLIRERAGRIDTLTTVDGLLSNNVYSLGLEADGTLWIGVEDGVNRLIDDRMTAYPPSSDRVEEIKVDGAGRVWFLAAGAGLLTFERDGLAIVEFENHPIGASPEAIAFDSYGALWVGTTGTGLHRLRQPLFTSYGPQDGLEATQFLGITEDWVCEEFRRGFGHEQIDQA